MRHLASIRRFVRWSQNSPNRALYGPRVNVASGEFRQIAYTGAPRFSGTTETIRAKRERTAARRMSLGRYMGFREMAAFPDSALIIEPGDVLRIFDFRKRYGRARAQAHVFGRSGYDIACRKAI